MSVKKRTALTLKPGTILIDKITKFARHIAGRGLLLVLCSLLSALSFAAPVPALSLQPDPGSADPGSAFGLASEVTLVVDYAEPATGYNLYRDGDYLSTHFSRSIAVSAVTASYCVVAFLKQGDTTAYSQCSTPLFLQVESEADSEVVDAEDADSEATSRPAAPAELRVAIYSDTAIELFWNPSSGQIKHYEIYREGVLQDTRQGNSYFDDSLQLGTPFRYDVVAVDNQSRSSLPASIAVLTDDRPGFGGQQPQSEAEPEDSQTPPGSPGLATNLRFESYSPTVGELFWDVSGTATAATRYELSRDGQVVAMTAGRSFFEPALSAGRQYVYQLVTIFGSGTRSEPLQLVIGDENSPSQNPQNAPSTPAPVEPAEEIPGESTDPRFELQAPGQRYVLREGEQPRLHVPVRLLRINGHQGNVQISVAALSDHSGSISVTSIDTPDLGGNATEAIFNVQLQLPVGPVPLFEHERTFRVVATDGQLSTNLDIVIDVVPVQAPDIYLLAGQSNMVGFSETGEKRSAAGEPDAPDDRILQLNVTPNNVNNYDYPGAFSDAGAVVISPRLIRAEDPLHDPLFPWFANKSGTFIGPGLSFAKSMLSSTTQQVIVVPAAWSGTGFCNNGLGQLAWNAWPTDQGFLGGTALADRALTRLNLALEESRGVFRGIIWHQGESDSNNPACAGAYRENLQALVNRFRSEARIDVRGPAARGAGSNVPFIVGTMSRGNDSRGNFSHFGAVKDQVDFVHRGISQLIGHSDFANHDDLVPPQFPCGNSSCVHFGAEAYRVMGSRYADALRRVWEQL